MDFKQEILEMPRVLREMLEKGRPEYEALVRKTRWGDGPIYVIGSGACAPVGLTAAYAFEGLLGWPVVARPAKVFATYGAALLRPRSILLVLSEAEESEETLETARLARSRGATVLALSRDPMSPLAQMADGVFLLRLGEEAGAGVKGLISAQAALGYISLVAARSLKRHHPQLDVLEQEFEKLPGHMEWVLSQMPDAVRSLASELKGLPRLRLVGAGFYHAAALEAAFLMTRLAGLEAEGFESSEVRSGVLPVLEREAVVVFLSGSRCRLKREVHQAAAQAKIAAARIISVTDGNDRELADRSALAVLLPILTEMVGSTLALTLLAWVAAQVARELGRESSRPNAKAPIRPGSRE